MNLPPVLTALPAIPLAEVAAPSADSALFGALLYELTMELPVEQPVEPTDELTMSPPDAAEVEETAVTGEAVEEGADMEQPIAEKPKRPRGYSAVESLLGTFVTQSEAALALPRPDGMPTETMAEKVLSEDGKHETAAPEALLPDAALLDTAVLDTAVPGEAVAETITRDVLPPTTGTIPSNDKKASPTANREDAEVPATSESVNVVPLPGEPPKADHESRSEETGRATVSAVPAPPASGPRMMETKPIPTARHEPVNPHPSPTVRERNPSPAPAKSNAPIAFALSLRLPETTVSETERGEPRPVEREAPDPTTFIPQPAAVRPAAPTAWSGAEEQCSKRDDQAAVGPEAFPSPETPIGLPPEAASSPDVAVPPVPATNAPAPAPIVETAPGVSAPVPLTTTMPDRPSSESRVTHPVAASRNEVSSDVRPDLEIRPASAPLEIRIDLPRSALNSAANAALPPLDLPPGAQANEAPHVQLQLREHRGEVTVSVRTADASLSRSLHERLPELVARLEGQGYETRAADPAGRFSPESARGVEGTGQTDEPSSGNPDGRTPPDQEQSSPRHRQRQQPHQQREADPESNSRRPTRQTVRWLEAWRTNNYTENTR